MTAPDPSTTEGRQALRELAAAATEGPWEMIPWASHTMWSVAKWEPDDAPSQQTIAREVVSSEVDAEFIAAYRTAGPAALDHIDELHTWGGLMRLLDEHYPTSIFPTEPDDASRDPGPRIVSLLRLLNERQERIGWLKVAYAEADTDAKVNRDTADRLQRERDELESRIAAVRAVIDDPQTVGWIERGGDVAWVATVSVRRALDGESR